MPARQAPLRSFSLSLSLSISISLTHTIYLCFSLAGPAAAGRHEEANGRPFVADKEHAPKWRAAQLNPPCHGPQLNPQPSTLDQVGKALADKKSAPAGGQWFGAGASDSAQLELVRALSPAPETLTPLHRNLSISTWA